MGPRDKFLFVCGASSVLKWQLPDPPSLEARESLPLLIR